MTQHTVILGAGYAGLLTALRLWRRTNGAARITLVNGSATFVERVRLHQVAADQPIVRQPIAAYLDGTNIAFVPARVTSLNPETQELHLDGQPPLHYDRLVYALGSRTETSSVPGITAYAFTLDGPLDRLNLTLQGAAKRGGRVTVCGSGLTGVEIATEIAESFPTLQVTMVSRREPGEILNDKARAHLHRAFNRLGIRLAQKGIAEIRAGAILADDGTLLPHDVCIWTGGFEASALATTAGLATNEKHQILTDAHLRSTSHPNIYAIGDAAKAAAECGRIHSACASAMPMGAYMADQLAGVSQEPFSFRPPGFCISLGRHDGIMQPYGTDERPTGTVFTGRFGAFIKESIVRYTTRMLWMTRRWAGAYHWTKRVLPVRAELPAAHTTRLAS